MTGGSVWPGSFPAAITVVVAGCVLLTLAAGVVPRADGPRATPCSAALSPEIHSAFQRMTYPVEFNETGLPVSGEWEVGLGTLDAQFVNWTPSQTTSIRVDLTNGTYPLSVTAQGDFAAADVPSQIVVDASARYLNVTFIPAFPVHLSETNLPWGSGWTVNLTSGNYSSSESSSAQNLTIMTTGVPFYFNVSSPGEVAIPASGNITNWTNQTFAIRFVPAVLPAYDGIIEGIVNVGSIATVYIGGFPRTVYPDGGFAVSLPASTYGVVVTAPGYVPFFGYTVLKANESNDIPVVLLPVSLGGSNTTQHSLNLEQVTILAVGGATVGALVTILAGRRRPPSLGSDLPGGVNT